MLRRTFLHINSVGQKRELGIWRAGITDWQQFVDKGPALLPPAVFRLGLPVIERSLAALDEPDGLARLAAMIPGREHWRFSPGYKRVAYLDIETGQDLSEWGGITVVGVYDGHQMRQYVTGRDIHEVNHALAGYEILVTFGGSSFDVPVLRSVFAGMILPPVHIDLRWLLKRVGLTGGLKRIERTLEIGRSEPVRQMEGMEAVRLWAEYMQGSGQALDLLLEYNAYDCLNLEPLLKLGVERLTQRLLAQSQVAKPLRG